MTHEEKFSYITPHVENISKITDAIYNAKLAGDFDKMETLFHLLKNAARRAEDEMASWQD